MGQTHILSLLIFSLLSASAFAATFIQSKCRATAYPAVCVQSLSSFASKIQHSPRQLAKTALTVSLSQARYTKAYVARLARSPGLRPREARALKDCYEQIGDAVDRLGKSARELQMAGRAGPRDREFKWRVSNVVTWASAALTDENTCVDGFEDRALDGRVKTAIKAQFDAVLQCTSNALALVNQFANINNA